MGLSAASLGVGLLNLGVSAWTAWKVHKMDARLQAIGARVDSIDGKLDSVAGLLEGSVVHLDGLISRNALMLGVLIEHQHQLGHGIELLRRDLADGFRSVHAAITDAEAQRKANELEQQMRVLYRYYSLCTEELQQGRVPPTSDLRRIIDIASELIAWLETRLAALPIGAPQRLPLFVAHAFALRLEIDARDLLGEAAASRNADWARLRGIVRSEVHAVTEAAPLFALASTHRELIEQYVFLHRALRGGATTLELEAGQTLLMLPRPMLVWDDGLQPVRELVEVGARDSVPESLELRTLGEHKAWRQLSGLPRGSADDAVRSTALLAALGLPPSVRLSEPGLRNLLREGPGRLESALDTIKSEVDE